MSDYIKKVLGQISDFVLGLSPTKKIAIGLVSAFIVVCLAGLFYWASHKSYRPLMTNLNPEDSANIVRVLREKKIPFRMDGTGKNIEIPPESIYDLRLELATLGLPQSSIVGYEVFDKQSLGQTSFVQKLNQKRALEGELMRTIGTIKGVKRSRVHLALPEKSTFVEDQKKSSASVVVDLEPGTTLSEKQIFGIGNLVASAVEGLEISDITVVDSHGKMLSKSARDPMVALTATQQDYRRKVEEDLERRVESMLSRIVGEGRVVATVTADLDFSQVNETQTVYDQDGAAVRSVVKNNFDAQGTRPLPSGAAGAKSNLPGELGSQIDNQVRNDTKKINEVTNYEVPQTVRSTRKEVGTIKKLSIAVVMDGKPVKVTGEDGKVQAKTEPWPVERVKEFETIVARAVGLDPKRGDALEIRNIEFSHEDFADAEMLVERAERRAYLKNIIIYGVIGIIIVLFFLFVVRPFIKWVTENTIDSVDTFLPQTIEELEKIQKQQSLPGLEEVIPTLPDKVDPEKVEGEMIREKIITLIDSNPQKAALILRDWIRGDKKKDAKDAGAAPAPGKSKSA